MLSLFPLLSHAQDNCEIQVYPYGTVEPRHTMVELHSNFTIQGSKTSENGAFPTNHQLHETIEITHGLTDWFEVGFYIFAAEKAVSALTGSATTFAPTPRPSQVEMARRPQSLQRSRLPATPVFRGYLDLGDATYH